jgi:RND family efflux transporter MFP subunit
MDQADPVESNPGHRRAAVKRGLGRALVAVALLLAGVAGGVVWSELRTSGSRAPAAPAPGASPPPRASPAGTAAEAEPVEITLAPEDVARAGIKTAPVQAERAAQTLSIPATVVSNAYRDTRVNALVGGILTQVLAELGASLRQGAVMAVIFSNELAEAQMKYLSMRAMVQADRQKLRRTEKLTELGAASVQELEEVRATHDARETEVAAARERLRLLGLGDAQIERLTGAAQIVSEVEVRSPVDGVVITRTVNPGQVIDAGQELFVVADLRTVWVLGDLYEQDLGQVQVGSPAVVSIPASPDTVLRGRVSYIDPRVEQATRTAKLRVEVPNPRGLLRLGMYVTVSLETRLPRPRPVIPRSAVQAVGDRTVVYVAVEDDEGQFIERRVTLGAAHGDRVEVIEGLEPGEKVVTSGSFFLRAEAARARSGG